MRMHICVIGGGTGTFTVLSGLKRHSVDLSAIVSIADNGGSTGILRDECGVLPPGDVRQCLVALSNGDELLRRMFNYRFNEGSLSGHNFGNMFLAVLEKVCGNSLLGIREAHRILNVRGTIIPVSAIAANLYAILNDGSVIAGEHTIDDSSQQRAAIDSCFLDPRVAANPDAINAIRTADAIVIGPGDLYTSLVPTLLVDGIAEALADRRGKLIYVVNLTTKKGQTDGYGAQRFVETINRYIHPATIDLVLVNNETAPDAVKAAYETAGNFAVSDDLPTAPHIVRQPLLTHALARPVAGDTLSRSLLRHDADKLAAAIVACLKEAAV